MHPFSGASLWSGYQTRSATAENPTGAVSGGAGRSSRKQSPKQTLHPGDEVVLADFAGPGTVTKLWFTLGSEPSAWGPELLRSQVLEVWYDELPYPSVSVPAADYCGVVHGVPAPYASAVTALNDVRGFVSKISLPFHRRIRFTWRNAGHADVVLYHQVDALLGALPPDVGLLHASFRRENPTTIGQDFVITSGLRGPGRYFGVTGGIRVIDQDNWWGEGEVKIYLDGETNPTLCGTGFEDYLESAWCLRTFTSPESGAPLVVISDHAGTDIERNFKHALISFYRWHLSDPIVFAKSLEVTVQQIGAEGETLYERADDWCATAFVYCRDPQPVEHHNPA